MIDNGNVCSQPIDGIAVVPITVCVEGRVSNAPVCYAHFGYRVLEPLFNVSLPYGGEGLYNVLSYTPDDWTPPATFNSTVPSLFLPNTSVTDAFRVQLPACSGSSIAWRLGDGDGNYFSAVVDADATLPCETGNYTFNYQLSIPITPMIDEGCVRRTLSGNCSVALGYFNPNYNTPVAFIPQAQANNHVYLMGGSGTISPAPLPSLFFPGRVHDAYLAEWSCPTGTEQLHWSLTTAGVTREAVARILCPAAQ